MVAVIQVDCKSKPTAQQLDSNKIAKSVSFFKNLR